MKLKSKKYYLAQFGLFNMLSLFVSFMTYVVDGKGFVESTLLGYLCALIIYILVAALFYCVGVIIDEKDA